MSQAISQATYSQRRAAEPYASVWVGANAGTGKTKVLTDRVLNLLLEGTAPERILCLTFTKAAAAEMATRLATKLSDWAVISDEELDKALLNLGRTADAQQRTMARRLFARLLDVPGGMRIETIHGFAQSLLRRFPLEAGVSPHFTVLDERSAADLMTQAHDQLLRSLRDDPSSALTAALAVVTANVHEVNFADLMQTLTSARSKLRRLFVRYGSLEQTLTALRERLGVPDGETPARAKAAAVAAFPIDTIRQLASVLGTGAKSDQDQASSLAHWLGLSPAEQIEQWTIVHLAVLTKQGEPRSRTKYPTKAVKQAHPEAEGLLDSLEAAVIRGLQRYHAARVAECSIALLHLGEALNRLYQQAKERQGALDFDDLIATAQDLLSNSEATAWVLYKLDGGIDHVMVDEAQDNSPDQWEIIARLTEDFFSGEGAFAEAVRTVFAVGDRKQSIYSFQGADPAAFDTMRARYQQAVPAANRAFHDVALDVSFRSVHAVLQLVDQVFCVTDAEGGVRHDDTPIQHIAARDGMAGSVEVWPVLKTNTTAEPDVWKPPVEVVGGDSAQTRLAQVLALRIKAMISGEMLVSQNRPITAGDILVLVRKRGGFVEELVRALKKVGVPVAGTDRMVLTEQMAVMDLLALGDVLLLPEDDLSLACVLKGPLIGLSEDDLLTIAAQRPKGVTLWRALREAAHDQGEPFLSAWNSLRGLMEQADFLPPHELYARILGPLRGREKLVGRLGPDALDPIDEFVQLTLGYDRMNPPSLQGFLHWIRSGNTEIKRDMAERGTDVRVMTVHGSKGLQAPIVILPDTCGVPSAGSKPKVFWDNRSGVLVWPPNSKERDPVSDGLAEARKDAEIEEFHRLLYVALTRAEDRLLICGWEGKKARPDGAWYNHILEAIQSIGEEYEDPFLAAEGPRYGIESPLAWRLTCPQTARVPEALSHGASQAAFEPLGAWASLPPAAEPTPPRPLAPSRVELPDPPARSPLETPTDPHRRFRRGTLVHRLLQSLPDIPAAHRPAAAATFLARPVWELPPHEQDALCQETLAVLDHPDIAPLFGPGSLAEVPVTGIVGGHVVSGQVDRLVVTPTEVLIIDFKTNRPPPRRVEDVAPAYCVQMALYRAVLMGIYPDRPVTCALVWTDGPFVMPLPAHVLDDSLKQHQKGVSA